MNPMSKISYIGICIGGPADGKIINSAAGQTIKVPQLSMMPISPASTTPTKTKFVDYTREAIQGQTTTFTFWRPVDQSIDDTIELLFKRDKGAE